MLEVLKKSALIMTAGLVAFSSPARAELREVPGPAWVEVEEPVQEVHVLEELGEFNITAYCACSKCNGKWGAIDGYGKRLEWGCVAVDPKVIPMKTKLVIDGYDNIFEARDTGSGVKGKHIDMFVPVSHDEARKMGVQRLKVWRVIR